MAAEAEEEEEEDALAQGGHDRDFILEVKLVGRLRLVLENCFCLPTKPQNSTQKKPDSGKSALQNEILESLCCSALPYIDSRDATFENLNAFDNHLHTTPVGLEDLALLPLAQEVTCSKRTHSIVREHIL